MAKKKQQEEFPDDATGEQTPAPALDHGPDEELDAEDLREPAAATPESPPTHAPGRSAAQQFINSRRSATEKKQAAAGAAVGRPYGGGAIPGLLALDLVSAQAEDMATVATQFINLVRSSVPNRDDQAAAIRHIRTAFWTAASGLADR